MDTPSKENVPNSGFAHLRKPFPPEKISTLTKKYKDKHTGEYHSFDLDYVGHADVTERLLEVDPLWYWEPMSCEANGLPTLVFYQESPVGLWIKLHVLGVVRIGYGSCEPGKVDAIKELIGDAIRNAAMRFGVALALWSKTKENDVSFQPASAGSARNNPPGQPKPQDFAEKVADTFHGSPAPTPTPSFSKVLGVTIPNGSTLEKAKNHLVNFGKNKGKTLGQLINDSEGRGYLEWLANKTATDLRAGTRKSFPSDFLVLVAYNSFQSPTVAAPEEPTYSDDDTPF
jgi:hypothetical protein